MLASCLLCLLVIQHTLGRAPLSRAYQVHKQRVAYFQDNDPAGAAIIALRISESDGTLSSPVRTLTGGKGLAGLIAISDDSVTVADDVCSGDQCPIGHFHKRLMQDNCYLVSLYHELW